MQLQHLPLWRLGWFGAGEAPEEAETSQNIWLVIPGTSTVAGKADEDGVQERTKED